MKSLVLPERPWQRAALGFSVAGFVAFGINLSFTIWATSRDPDTIQDGVGVLLEQDCTSTKRVNTALHIVINIISATLLAGSNYCMQCVTAPTRPQVDAAHERGKWLDIGVPGIRNFFSISWTKRLIWLMLSITSLPLHLFYNSAVLSSTSVNEYATIVFGESDIVQRNFSRTLGQTLNEMLDSTYVMLESGEFEEMSIEEAIRAYTRPYQSSYGSALIVVNDSYYNDTGNFSNPWPSISTHLMPTSYTKTWDWLCKNPSRVSPERYCENILERVLNGEEEWESPWGVDVKKIYAMPTQEHCKVLYSLHLCWLVTVMNLVKASFMLWVALGDAHDPLLTIGDAIASFLRDEDPHTHSMCLREKRDFSRSFTNQPTTSHPRPSQEPWWLREPVLIIGTSQDDDDKPSFFRLTSRPRRDQHPWLSQESALRSSGAHTVWSADPVKCNPRPRRRWAAAGIGRWALSMILFLTAWFAVLGLLVYGLKKLKQTLEQDADVEGLGLGTVQTETLLTVTMGQGTDSMIRSVLLANTPQIILSSLYVILNALLTSFSVAREWNGFGFHRKSLRVSSRPTGSQRETYFLQLPYRLSIPLIGLSALLHWLISQSLFVVALETFSASSVNYVWTLSSALYLGQVTCGWSPLGCIATLVVGAVLIIFIFGCGWPRLPCSTMPLVGSCSAAIAAACHLDPPEYEAWEQKLMWGCTSGGDVLKGGHCSFSSEEVEPLIEGVSYE